MNRLKPATVMDAGTLGIADEPVPGDQVVSGTPAAGFIELDEESGIGVWEMTPGAMRDVEADEVFVVLSGDATVSFIEPPLAPIDLRPGSIVRLVEGMQTVWTVRETLRKVYIEG